MRAQLIPLKWYPPLVTSVDGEGEGEGKVDKDESEDEEEKREEAA
jgi:hypothetical protein